MAMQKRVKALHQLQQLLSRSEFCPVEAALKAEANPYLFSVLHWALQMNSFLRQPGVLQMLQLENQKRQKHVACITFGCCSTWRKKFPHCFRAVCVALGNVADEGEELRYVLLSQGALPPLARMMLLNKNSTVRTAAWTFSNLTKGPDPKAATELISVEGVLDAILQHFRKLLVKI
ncbi:hypothetical protein SLEP1_g57829 [Rubroshorea leprosula]|nr:hypothetical protein SLEP1_g57829 [Rubroshorea leprosula]